MQKHHLTYVPDLSRQSQSHQCPTMGLIWRPTWNRGSTNTHVLLPDMRTRRWRRNRTNMHAFVNVPRLYQQQWLWLKIYHRAWKNARHIVNFGSLWEGGYRWNSNKYSGTRRTWYSARKGELEKPIFKTDGIILHKETPISDESCVTITNRIATVGKGISDRPKGNTTTCRV